MRSASKSEAGEPPKRGTYVVPQQQKRPVSPRISTVSSPSTQYTNAANIARAKGRNDWNYYNFHRLAVRERNADVEAPSVPAHLLSAKAQSHQINSLLHATTNAEAEFAEPREIREIQSKFAHFARKLGGSI